MSREMRALVGLYAAGMMLGSALRRTRLPKCGAGLLAPARIAAGG